MKEYVLLAGVLLCGHETNVLYGADAVWRAVGLGRWHGSAGAGDSTAVRV